MKKLSCVVLSVLIMVCCFSVAGCGVSFTKNAAGGTSDKSAQEEYNLTTDSEDVAISESTTFSETSDTLKSNRKIIETIDLSLQTKEFDLLLEKINNKVAKLGGYVEASEIEGREIDSADTRWASLTVRIPSKKSQEFGKYISENSVVVNRSVSTEDVTLQYVDTESRVSALESEKKALEKLLEKADTVENIISIRDKLTEVIYEIETLKSQLRTYDNLVDYTTVTISVDEVERTAVVEKQTVWQEIGTNLKNNFSDIGGALVALFVFIVSAIPYLIPVAILTVTIILIIRIRNKRRKKKYSQPEEK